MQHQNTYTHNNMILIHNIKHFFLIFCYNKQKKQAIISSQKYLIHMIPFTTIIQKGTNNNFLPEIFNSYDAFYYNKQKGTSNNSIPEIFNLYDTFCYNKPERNKQ